MSRTVLRATMTVVKEYEVEDPAAEGYRDAELGAMCSQDERLFEAEPNLVIDGASSLSVQVEVVR